MNADRLQLTIVWFIGVIVIVLIVGSMLRNFHVDNSVANLISFGMGALATALRPRGSAIDVPNNSEVKSESTTTVTTPKDNP